MARNYSTQETDTGQKASKTKIAVASRARKMQSLQDKAGSTTRRPVSTTNLKRSQNMTAMKPSRLSTTQKQYLYKLATKKRPTGGGTGSIRVKTSR